MSKSDDIALEGWRKSHGITPKSNNGGFISRLGRGVKARIDERISDLNQRIEHPKEWREKHHKEILANNSMRISELKQEAKIAKYQASKARSENMSRRYAPSYDSGGGAGIFDLGGGGGGDLFDLGDGGGGLGGSSVPLFDLGFGEKPKKKRANKKSKNNGKGVHIHIK